MSSEILRTKFAHYRLGLIAAAVLAVVTSIPQIALIVKQGPGWQGSYALMDFDELSYSAYVNALINGRPRQNNPYLAKSSDQQESGETYFSVQILPAFAIALPARILGISTSSAVIAIRPLMAFLSSLSVFGLLFQITKSETTSAVGVLIVLFCGRLISESPFLAVQYYSSFAFLRFYVPALAFPLFFLFCGFVWRTLSEGSTAWALGAAVTLTLLLYSYFYLWTTGAAWLACLTIFWLVGRRDERRNVLKLIFVVGGVLACSVLPYLYLLASRSTTLAEDQALTSSRTPDLFRITEMVGVIVLLVLAIQIRRKRVDWKSRESLFLLACAATPLLVFNQQMVSGLYLQSFHYEQFIVNYVVLVSVVGTYHLIWAHSKIRPVLWAAFAICIGLATAFKEVHDHMALNVFRDQARPVFERLRLSEGSGLALINNSLLAASAQTDALVPQLWTPNIYLYGGIGQAERVERFYQYLYLLNVEPATLQYDLQNNGQVRVAVFGLHRVNAGLSQSFTPVSADEIRLQVEAYSAYIQNFSQHHANRWPIAYVITTGEGPYNFTNLDRWYTRDAGENVGNAVFYTVKLKPQP